MMKEISSFTSKFRLFRRNFFKFISANGKYNPKVITIKIVFMILIKKYFLKLIFVKNLLLLIERLFITNL